MGYRTTAMYPQNPVNWKRSTVYEQLGFNEFLSMENFADAPVYHSGATDASTYDKVIELLEQDASPQFIFDVTMQNHSGYGEGTVPSEDVVRLDVAGAEVGAPRTTDSSQLAAQVLYTLGAPLTDRQKAVLVLGQEVAGVSLAGYTGADGLRYALGVESPFGDSVNAMQAIQYLEFGETIGS